MEFLSDNLYQVLFPASAISSVDRESDTKIPIYQCFVMFFRVFRALSRYSCSKYFAREQLRIYVFTPSSPRRWTSCSTKLRIYSPGTFSSCSTKLRMNSPGFFRSLALTTSFTSAIYLFLFLFSEKFMNFPAFSLIFHHLWTSLFHHPHRWYCFGLFLFVNSIL